MYTADTGKAKSASLLRLDASLDYQAPTIVLDGWYWLIAIYLRTYLHASLHWSCVNRLRTRSARWSSINKRGAATIDCKPPLYLQRFTIYAATKIVMVYGVAIMLRVHCSLRFCRRTLQPRALRLSFSIAQFPWCRYQLAYYLVRVNYANSTWSPMMLHRDCMNCTCTVGPGSPCRSPPQWRTQSRPTPALQIQSWFKTLQARSWSLHLCRR